MSGTSEGPLLRALDAIQIPVPDLDEALAFYCDRLGHELKWRNERSAGLRLPGSEAELVLETGRPELEPNMLVESVEDAVRRFVAAGGTIEAEPSDIPVGRVAIVRDPFGNRLVLLDLSKGRYVTDVAGNVTGVEPN
ncbi:MAG: VOC family protein [Dehalococcoidia bacterium]